ncbi:MAG TPA: hypothetical protein VNS57_06495 [Steroidobacteraceae bacterium]|nr:hypothetical protein [Steroidobacteraceae bacterium]
MSKPRDVQIEVEVRGNKIICDPAVTVFQGKRVEWVAGPDNPNLQFELSFDSSKPPGIKPFPGAPPAHQKTPAASRYGAIVTATDDQEFKYTVYVAGANDYDPMIIVGR